MKATVTKVTKRLEVKEVKSEGVLSYDIDNNYPDRISNIVAASGMGKTCVSLYTKFIFGRGFQNQEFGRISINRKKLTPNKLLLLVSKHLAKFGGFCLHFNYNAKFEITEVNFQPLSHVRYTTEDCDYPNMFALYKNWGEKSIRKDKLTYINKFNPDPEQIIKEVTAAGGWQNYKGQIFYYSNEGDEYPMPLFDAELEDMQTDAQAKIGKFRNVTTNFMASHLVITTKTEAPDGHGDETREPNTLITTLEDFQGADNNSKLCLIEKDSDDQLFEIKKVDQQDNDHQFEFTENSVRDNIRQSFLIPSVLLMSTPGKLGTADEIIDATKYYNSVTEDERLKIEEVFQLIFSQYYFDKTVNSDNNYSIVERKAVVKDDAEKKKNVAAIVKDGAYTAEQKILLLIELYDYDVDDATALVKPSDAPDTGQSLAEKLQIDGTQNLIGVLTNPLLTPAQKRGTLKALFDLSDDKINLILPPDGTPPNNA